MKPWLGRCHLYQGDGADRVDYEALVAVFCAEIEAFDGAVRAHLDGKDMRLLWSEERHPAGEWLARNPSEKHAADLARSVHERHPVEIGTLTQSGAVMDSEAQSYLTIEEHKITPLPDQTGIPFWDKEWITPELKELLFGQPKTGETLRTYFIVDVILRKKITKLFDLDTVDVPVKCLFKGDAAVDLKEAAPYLIDMTLPDGAWDDKDLVPNFHKDFFDKHWGANTGIFIRSTADMDAIWNHFRKFTRVQVEEDKRWVFFRFWDPRIAPSYFCSIKDIPEKAAQWVDIRGTGCIENIVGNRTDSANAWCITPAWDKIEGFSAIGQPMLSEAEMKGFEKYKLEKFDRETAQSLHSNYPELKCDIQQFQNFARIVRTWSCAYGIRGERDITHLIHLSLALGAYFPNDVRFYHLADILRDDSNPPNVRVKNCVANAKKWLRIIWDGHTTQEMETRLAQVIGQPFESYSDSKALSRLARQLNLQYVDSTDNDTLNAFVRQCRSICDVHKINGNYARICYILCALHYGQNFIDDPLQERLVKSFADSRDDTNLRNNLIETIFKIADVNTPEQSIA